MWQHDTQLAKRASNPDSRPCSSLPVAQATDKQCHQPQRSLGTLHLQRVLPPQQPQYPFKSRYHPNLSLIADCDAVLQCSEPASGPYVWRLESHPGQHSRGR